MSKELKKSSHLITILTLLLEGKKLSSSDVFASNSNQYFGTIKKQGIELIEVWKPNDNNRGKHKERSINQTIENIKKAESFLGVLLGSKKDEKIRA